jgi:hypothetical protein
MQCGSPKDYLCSNVITQAHEHDIVDLYTVGASEENAKVTRPFVHQVELQGTKRDAVHIQGLFDDGALVNSICSSVFKKLRHLLGHLQPSNKTLRMADSNRVKSHGQWVSEVGLGGKKVQTTFEIFPSGKGWSLLFGKPLLQKFGAVHDYTRDTLHIPLNDGSWTTLSNECGETRESTENSRGIEISPSRQVS